MSSYSKVVWSEGLFLRPQHFQQEARYLEDLVQKRAAPLRAYPWGVTELQLDQRLLGLGKLAVAVARGVFPDGTAFNIPDDDEPPAPLDLDENMRNELVHLALPVRRAGAVEIGSGEADDGLSRYRMREQEVRDAHGRNDTVAQLRVGSLHCRLLPDSAAREDYHCLGVARVVEVRADKAVVLDPGYVSPALDALRQAPLANFVKELQGLLHHRAEALAGRLGAAGQGGAAEIADFLLLQLVNRAEPLVTHLATLERLHPERLYVLAVTLAGELATFTSETKRASEFPPYRHDDLQGSFAPVVAALRQSLSMVLEQNAIPIALEERKYGIRVAALADRSLIGQATFVLAVNAQIPAEELRRRFPAQVKIGPVEQIRQLVNVQLPGIRVTALPVAPRQLPYHAGFVYFELDRASPLWTQMRTSGGFALHVGGEFPGIEMEFWAIKG